MIQYAKQFVGKLIVTLRRDWETSVAEEGEEVATKGSVGTTCVHKIGVNQEEAHADAKQRGSWWGENFCEPLCWGVIDLDGRRSDEIEELSVEAIGELCLLKNEPLCFWSYDAFVHSFLEDVL